MKTRKFIQKSLLSIVFGLLIFSCVRVEDPGPLQNDERDFAVQNFDRIDMDDAFVITVQQSPTYSVHVRGDRRNIDDLIVKKNGSTLSIRYGDGGSHEHITYIEITMPAIVGASLGGASQTTIRGFKNGVSMEMILSGASLAQLNIESKQVMVNLTGASQLTMSGKAETIYVKTSGASELYAYEIPAMSADVEASGASRVNVYASQSLKALANGAGVIYYRGEASVSASSTGAGAIIKD